MKDFPDRSIQKYDVLKIKTGYIFLKDRFGRYTSCNIGFSEMLGLSSADVIGKCDDELFPDDIARAIVENDHQVMSEKKSFLFEEKIIDKEQVSRIWFIQKTPIYDKKCVVTGVEGIAIDVTDVRKKEIERQAHFKNVVSIVPGHLFWMDREGKILGCNDQQAKTFGLTVNELEGKNIYDVGKLLRWSPAVSESTHVNDIKILTTGHTEIFEENILLAGKERCMLTHKGPMYDAQGQIIGIVGCAIDITERRKMENELRKAKEVAEKAHHAKTEFLMNMEHDLRTPLAGALGLSTVLSRHVNNPQLIKKGLQDITQCTKELMDFCNTILDFSKIELGCMTIASRKFNLKHLINRIFLLQKPSLDTKKLNWHVVYSSQVPEMLVSDDFRIYRVLLNLVSNAIKFTQKGSVKVEVALKEKINAHHVILALSVKDTGMGIPQEQQKFIFERFTRLTMSNQGLYKGSGLGLAIVKQFIDDLHGDIQVQSSEDQGSTFTCFIPFKIAPLEKQSKNTVLEDHIKPISLTQHKRAKTWILLVEDNMLVSETTKNMLSHLNCQVDVAKDGKTALKLFKENYYDLVFMDIGLPDLNGYEVTKQIRLYEEGQQQVPIIALSAHTDQNHQKNCIASGMNAVFVKPLTTEQACEVLSSFVTSWKEKKTKKVKTSHKVVKSNRVLDLKYVKEHLKYTQKTFHSLLKLLIQDIDEELLHFREAYQCQDWDALSALAHKMKGSAVYCGALRLKAACEQLEHHLKLGNKKRISVSYQSFLKECQAVKRAVKRKLG